jgi:hypothetical protein
MVFLISVNMKNNMKKNIKLIIKKIYKPNKIYFLNEEYNDFKEEFKYKNSNITIVNIPYIYNLILQLIKKYKVLLIIITIIIVVFIKYLY